MNWLESFEIGTFYRPACPENLGTCMLELTFLEMFVSGVVAIGVANPQIVAKGRHECAAFCGTCR